MASSYPGALDTFTIPSSGTLGGTNPTLHEVEQKAADAILAVQTILGINPQGASASVKARLDALATAPPVHHATEHAIGGGDVLTPAAIGAETPAGATTKVTNHTTAGHPQHSTVKGGVPAPPYWYRQSTLPFPTSVDGAADGDILVVY